MNEWKLQPLWAHGGHGTRPWDINGDQGYIHNKGDIQNLWEYGRYKISSLKSRRQNNLTIVLPFNFNSPFHLRGIWVIARKVSHSRQKEISKLVKRNKVIH